MGRRSRKRRFGDGAAEQGDRSRRAERGRVPAGRSASGANARPGRAPRPRASIDERPPALWGSFPLTELLTLAGIALMAWGFLSGGGRDGNAKLAAGLLIASIAGLELAVREHVTGFRSHTTLLAGATGILAIVALGLGAGLETLGFLVLAGGAAFVGSFVALRELFKRRSGGLSFR